jgi:hypothetical protein
MTAERDEPPQDAETVVEGEAIELPSEPAPVDSAAAYAPPPPTPATGGAAPYAPAGPAASGPGWPDPGIDLAERPEILVGAAFGGGLLLAMILRKLGR